MVLLELFDFFFVAFLLVFKLIGKLLMLLEGVLNVGVFDLFVSLKGQLVLFLQSFNLLPVDYVQLLLLQLQFLLWSQDLELQLFDSFILLFDFINSLEVEIVGTLGDSLPIFWLYEWVPLLLLFFRQTCKAKAQDGSIFRAGKDIAFVMWCAQTHNWIAVGNDL